MVELNKNMKLNDKYGGGGFTYGIGYCLIHGI